MSSLNQSYFTRSKQSPLLLLGLAAIFQFPVTGWAESEDNKVNTREGQTVNWQNKVGTFRLSGASKVTLKKEGDHLDLKKGLIFVKSAGKIRRKKIHVAVGAANISGRASMLISYQPRKYVKLVCLSGTVEVSLPSLVNQRIKIRKGQMLILNCLENYTPRVVSVDMGRLLSTSRIFRSAPADAPGGAGGVPPSKQRRASSPPPPPAGGIQQPLPQNSGPHHAPDRNRNNRPAPVMPPSPPLPPA